MITQDAERTHSAHSGLVQSLGFSAFSTLQSWKRMYRLYSGQQKNKRIECHGKGTLYPEPRPLAASEILEPAEDYRVAVINAIEAS
nr:artemisinic aldehyde delta-11(13) reductase [Tanacetum cinerariifolium]